MASKKEAPSQIEEEITRREPERQIEEANEEERGNSQGYTRLL